MKADTVLCRLCNEETGNEYQQLCDRCWELEERIILNPKLAKKIMEEIGYVVKFKT